RSTSSLVTWSTVRFSIRCLASVTMSEAVLDALIAASLRAFPWSSPSPHSATPYVLTTRGRGRASPGRAVAMSASSRHSAGQRHHLGRGQDLATPLGQWSDAEREGTRAEGECLGTGESAPTSLERPSDLGLVSCCGRHDQRSRDRRGAPRARGPGRAPAGDSAGGGQARRSRYRRWLTGARRVPRPTRPRSPGRPRYATGALQPVLPRAARPPAVARTPSPRRA